MRRALLALILVLSCASGLVPGQAAADLDWVVHVVTAGPQGAKDVALTGGWTADVVGDDPILLAKVIGFAGSVFGDASVLGHDPASVTTSADLGGLEVEVTEVPSSGGAYSSNFYWIRALGPGEVVAIAWLAPGMRFEQFDLIDVSQEPAQVDVQTHAGRGASTVGYVEPDSIGPGIQAGGAAAGLVRTPRALTRGIVGAFVEDCTRCEFGWVSPDGRAARTPSMRVCAGVLITLCTGSFNQMAYAGPGGAWEFIFDGVREPVYTGHATLTTYAPIGALWSAFTGPLD